MKREKAYCKSGYRKDTDEFANSCRNVYDAAAGNAYGRSAECRNAGDEFYSRCNECKYDGGWSTTKKSEDILDEEPEDNEFLDFSFGM